MTKRVGWTIAASVLFFVAGLQPAKGALTLDERIACGYAVEQVYHQHRIWPEANPGEKPPLTELLSLHVLRDRVERSLLATNALAAHWHHKISGADLQAEIERMFAQTRKPDMLRAIAAALGNDAERFAECVARPALAQRLLRSFHSSDERFREQPLEDWLDARRPTLGLEVEPIDFGYDLPPPATAASATTGGGTGEVWTPLQSLPEGTAGGTAVWTGSEMIVWGGGKKRNGSRYDPATDSWSTVSANDAPFPRSAHSAVWTGTKMIVWGGCGQFTNFCDMGDGSAYDPVADTWQPISNAADPVGRRRNVAVWTGTEMLIWGGCRTSTVGGNNNCSIELSDGGRYDPNSDTWFTISDVNAPGKRFYATGVWTGTELVVWGGYDGLNALNDGGRYDPATDTWAPLSISGAPDGRSLHTAIWTGAEMLVWGGCDGSFCHPQFTYYDTGGRYDPATDAWAPTSLAGAPSARGQHSAVWTGTEMIVWGGDTAAGAEATGGRYDPTGDTWTPTATLNAPSARSAHLATWTGDRLIVWGGTEKSGGRYDPATDTWTPTNASDPGEAREDHTAVWTGAEMLVWGGDEVPDWIGPGRGDRYDPATGLWTPMSTDGAPSQRERAPTSVWTGTEMIVWGGQTGNWLYDTGGRYDPVSDSWTPTSTTGAPSARVDYAFAWSGTEMLIWGGHSLVTNSEDTGFRYDPGTDSWTPMSLVGAPPGRRFPTGVWTGSEMIVWGGFGSLGDLADGARYDPATDGWTPISTVGAPAGRHYHTALWTGGEMLIWGGMEGNLDNGTYFNSGGRYDLASDSWLPMSNVDVPGPRIWHGSVWTGSEMLVWGGCTGSTSCPDAVFTGGRYDPAGDTWSALTTQSAPSRRSKLSAVWDGTEMLVWGGYDDANGTYTTTGAGLDPYVVFPPGEVSPAGAAQPLEWTDRSTLVWENGSASGSVTFNLYRGRLADLTGGDSGDCHESGIPTNTTVDGQDPPAGDGWCYLVAGVNEGGEGTLGEQTDGTPRTVGASCP